jgi:hypothetical protein
MIMLINHSLNQPMINRYVKIVVHLSLIKINHDFLKSSLVIFTEMRYNVLLCRCRYIFFSVFLIAQIILIQYGSDDYRGYLLPLWE